MKKEIGLWIDHSQAVMVITLDQEEEIKHITSNMDKHIHYSGTSEPDVPSKTHNDTREDERDQSFDTELNHYYDEVISYLHNARSILILGPDEAKVQLQKRLEDQGANHPIVTIKSTDKMTDKQITAEVRKYFRES